jgi:hypothetical protein
MQESLEQRERASSRGATMEVRERLKNTPRTLPTVGEEAPFIANQNRAVGGKFWAETGQKSVSPGSAPDRPVQAPGPNRFGVLVGVSVLNRRKSRPPRCHWAVRQTGRCTAQRRRPETGHPVKIPAPPDLH